VGIEDVEVITEEEVVPVEDTTRTGIKGEAEIIIGQEETDRVAITRAAIIRVVMVSEEMVTEIVRVVEATDSDATMMIKGAVDMVLVAEDMEMIVEEDMVMTAEVNRMEATGQEGIQIKTTIEMDILRIDIHQEIPMKISDPEDHGEILMNR
jgi:hypothetical protein